MDAQARRVLFLTDRFPPQIGGAAAAAWRHTGHLAAAGWVTHVLHLDPGTPPGAVCSAREEGVMVHRLGLTNPPDLALQLAETVAAHLHAEVGFALCHGHGAVPAGYLATYLARRFGAASFVSVRGNDVERSLFRADQFPFLLWTLEHADAVGCVSRELVEKCAALGRTDAVYFPNAVDSDLFRPLPRDPALLPPAPDTVTLGFVGELRAKKGTGFLLDAFATVAAARPARLLLVGSLRGEDRAVLRRFLRQHPALRPQVIAVPYQTERDALAGYSNQMDLVLAPSLWDGMPNSVLEAMACARPVLAADAGGIRDLITHGDTGALLGIHALDHLGDACLELLALGDALPALGARARTFVRTHHAPAAEAARLGEMYAAVLATHI